MLSLVKYLLPKGRSKKNEFTVPSMTDLIRKESTVGSKLFGIVPPDRKRQFFCLDESTWVWYEEWTNETGVRQAVTTRYEIRGDAILKVQGERQPERLHGQELENLTEAIRSYYYRVAKEVYHRPVRA